MVWNRPSGILRKTLPFVQMPTLSAKPESLANLTKLSSCFCSKGSPPRMRSRLV